MPPTRMDRVPFRGSPMGGDARPGTPMWNGTVYLPRAWSRALFHMFRRHGAAQQSKVGGMALRPAQCRQGPETFDDLRRVVLLPPQSFDEPFGLGSQGLGLSARPVTCLQGRRVPEA